MIKEQSDVVRPQSPAEGSLEAANLAADNLITSVVDTAASREPSEGPRLGEAIRDVLWEDTKVFFGPATRAFKTVGAALASKSDS